MTFAPKACPRCGGKLNIDFDIKDDGYTDVVIYECLKCGWEAQR